MWLHQDKFSSQVCQVIVESHLSGLKEDFVLGFHQPTKPARAIRSLDVGRRTEGSTYKLTRLRQLDWASNS